MIKVGLGVRVSCMVRVSVRNIFLRLGLVPGLYKWLFYLATVRQLKHVVNLKAATGRSLRPCVSA